MKCNNCGAEYDNPVKFCNICGKAMEQNFHTEIPQSSQQGKVLNVPSRNAQTPKVKNEQEALLEEMTNNPGIYNFATSAQNPQPEVYNAKQMPRRTKAAESVPTQPVSGGYKAEVPVAYPVPPKEKKSGSGMKALLISLIAVLILVIGAACTIVYCGVIEPVDKDSVLGKVFSAIGLDGFDKSDRTTRYSYELTEEEPTAKPTEKPKKHEYTVRVGDVTWTEAKSRAKNYGEDSYLAAINDKEEFYELTQMAYERGLYILWLGAVRDYDDDWTDVEWLDGSNFKSYGLWLPGEPSYYSDENIAERYLMAFYVDGEWYLNDAGNDVSQFYSGRIGYIIEEEVE